MTKHKTEWTPVHISQILANPFYTGIRVHPDLCVPRPTHRDKYIAISKQSIEDFGAKQWLREFLLRLQQPDTWALLGIRADKIFTEDRPAIVTEEQFIEAGERQIKELGVIPYLNALLNNLEVKL